LCTFCEIHNWIRPFFEVIALEEPIQALEYLHRLCFLITDFMLQSLSYPEEAGDKMDSIKVLLQELAQSLSILQSLIKDKTKEAEIQTILAEIMILFYIDRILLSIVYGQYEDLPSYLSAMKTYLTKLVIVDPLISLDYLDFCHVNVS
jgi:hypothetical protein